jgi:DNA-binding NarL/FixJ family response regulator
MFMWQTAAVALCKMQHRAICVRGGGFMLRIVLVEDDPRFRQRFSEAIAGERSMRIVAERSTVAGAVACLETVEPDVLLVDLGLPDGSGIEVIRRAAVRHPACDVVVITVFGDQDNVLASIEAGASGYLLKDDVRENYAERIHELRAGGSPISPIIARQLLRKFQVFPAGAAAHAPAKPVENITDRERDVLNLLSRGFNYQEIAGILSVSKNTIGSYIKRVYGKLQVNSRSEAVFEARKMGILP